MNEQHYSYEIILIDDGSTDNSWDVITSLSLTNPNIKGIRFQRNYGKSAALNEGFKASLGNVVITMDADMQDSPDEIPELYRLIAVDGYDMISGWKKNGMTIPLPRIFLPAFFNWSTRRISKIPLHDFNCGLKSYKRKVVKSIEVYGEMHRYIPVLAKWAGFRKIGEKVVEHRKRKYGTTKFGWERFVNGFLDLASIMFVSKYGKRPMHFFGLIGSISFLIRLLMILVLIIGKIADPNKGLTNRRPSIYL